MDEGSWQQRRIDHLIVTTGKKPTVLDIDGTAFDNLKNEFIQYSRRLDHLNDGSLSEVLERGFTFHGVHFVRGLKRR